MSSMRFVVVSVIGESVSWGGSEDLPFKAAGEAW